MRAHSNAIDMVGSAHLHDCQSTNSDSNSVVFFDGDNEIYSGFEGGCGGRMDCTAKRNYFIQDHSGAVLYNGTKIIPNN